MKIASYAVEASASRSFTQIESTTTLLTNELKKPDEANAPADAEANANAQQAEEQEASLDLSEQVKEMLKKAAEQREQSLHGLARSTKLHSGKKWAYSKEEVKLSLLEQMMEALTGKKVKAKKADPPAFENGNNSAPPHGRRHNDIFGGGGRARMVQTRSMTTEHFMYESESVSYSAKGVINTEDGQQISVDVNMYMSRQYSSYTQVSMEFDSKLCDPLVINYAGSAASLTDETYEFDLDFDGTMDQISFAGEGSGFLALDKNGDGKVNDGSELFGPQTGSGFAELRAYDQDGNGWIDENDDVYSKLSVWSKDADGNDVMYSLKEADVGAIYLGDVDTQFSITDEGNNTKGVMRSTSFFLKDSGGAGTVSHIDLSI